MSKLISSFASLNGPLKPNPQPLDFKMGWGVGPIFDWYRNLTKPEARLIEKIQIWKYIGKAVPHRFIVIHMSDNTSIHRFDRRPDRAVDDITMLDLVGNYPVACQDSYELGIRLESVSSLAVNEIELTIGGRVDLMAVVSTCYAISVDESIQKYSLFRYNCFFFAWTILMVVSRQYLPYRLPEPTQIVDMFKTGVGSITKSILDVAIDLFRDMVIEVLTIFREKAGTRLHVGMNPIAKVAWGLPDSVIRFLWRRLFSIRLYLGWREKLGSKIRQEIEKAAQVVASAAVSAEGSDILLNKHLWIDDTKNDIKETLRAEVIKVIWKCILEAISDGLGSLTPQQLADELARSRPRFSILGRNAAQYTAVWNAGLHGGLQAVKMVSESLRDAVTHEVAFQKAWEAARDGALGAAQTVVKNTSQAMKQPQRDQMWGEVWKIWEPCWDDVRGVVQPRSVQTVETIIESVISSGVSTMIKDMKKQGGETIQARIANQIRMPNALIQSGRQVTNAELQKIMYGMMQQGTLTPNALKEVYSSMGRVWEKTLETMAQEASASNAP